MSMVIEQQTLLPDTDGPSSTARVRVHLSAAERATGRAGLARARSALAAATPNPDDHVPAA